MAEITVTMPLEAAANTAIAVKQRLLELEGYHRDFPNLPRQDDVVHTYAVALESLNRELPEWARQ